MLSHRDLSIEKEAASVLLDESITVTISGKNYSFKRSTLHQTDWIGKYHLSMPLDIAKIDENAIYEGNTYYYKNSRKASMICAIILKGRHWTFGNKLTRWIGRMLVRVYANELFYRFTANDYLTLMHAYAKSGETADFINATRLTAGSRTTIPKAEIVAEALQKA